MIFVKLTPTKFVSFTIIMGRSVYNYNEVHSINRSGYYTLPYSCLMTDMTIMWYNGYDYYGVLVMSIMRDY